jgi:hypothetical protein
VNATTTAYDMMTTRPYGADRVDVRAITSDLRSIALSHARSRTLSPDTRSYFYSLAAGETPDFTPEGRALAFFEAAGSCATRGAHSMDRRRMVADLARLHKATAATGALPERVVDVRMPMSALRLIGTLLDFHDDEELAANSGEHVVTIDNLRDAVRTVLTASN